MESNAKIQLKIGIFLAVGLVIILGSIFMLGGDKAFFKSYVTLHARFTEVQGLAEGSVVSLSGINVGNIKAINLIPGDNVIDVVLLIDRKYMARVTDGSSVEIRTQGALGDKYIFIIPGDPKGKELADNSAIEVAKPSDLFGMLSSRSTDAEKIFDIIDEIYKVTRTINGDNRLDRIMSGLASASGKLDKTADQAQKLIASLNEDSPKVRSSMVHLDSVLAKIDHGQGTLGALVNDSTLHDQLKAMLGGANRKTYMKSLMRTSIEKNEEK